MGVNCLGFIKILTTVLSQERRDFLIKERCPSCRAPIVGTNPIEPFKLEEWWVILRLENQIISDFTSTIKQKMCLELFEEFLTKQVEKRFHNLPNMF